MALKDYEKELTTCKSINNDLSRSNCVYELLFEITEIQDRIQLSIPALSEMQSIMGNITDKANAILLGISKWKGADQVIEHGYVTEKVMGIVDSYNSLIRDYNLTHEDKISSYEIELRKPRVKTDIESIKRDKEMLYNGIKGTYIDNKWMLVKEGR